MNDNNNNNISILPPSLRALEDTAIASAETTWAALSGASKPDWKIWDQGVAVNQASQLMSRAAHDVDRARLLAASAPHSG